MIILLLFSRIVSIKSSNRVNITPSDKKFSIDDYDPNSSTFKESNQTSLLYQIKQSDNKNSSTDNKMGISFKDPFEDDKFTYWEHYKYYTLFLSFLGLCGIYAAAAALEYRVFQNLMILFYLLKLIHNYILCAWLFKYSNAVMPFKYNFSIVVLCSVANAIPIFCSYLALHGVGIYTKTLKLTDIIVITIILIITIVANIFLSLSYYIFDEKIYKIIISVLLPVIFIIELLPLTITPSQFRVMKEQLLEGLDDDSDEYKKISEIFSEAKKMALFSIVHLLGEALSPVKRYIIHFEYGHILFLAESCFSIAQIYSYFGMFNPMMSYHSQVFIDTLDQQDEPSYLE